MSLVDVRAACEGCVAPVLRDALQPEFTVVSPANKRRSFTGELTLETVLPFANSEAEELIRCMTCAFQAKEPYTIPHSVRTSSLACAFADHLGFPALTRRHLQIGGILHDIGKLWIPNSILLKSDPLETSEWVALRRHPEIGAAILARAGVERQMIDIVEHHHEQFDGTGYPHGLKGDKIPAHARLLAIADCLDALISNRPYRPAWNAEEAMRLIRAQAGSHFDPQMVERIGEVSMASWIDRSKEISRAYTCPWLPPCHNDESC